MALLGTSVHTGMIGRDYTSSVSVADCIQIH